MEKNVHDIMDHKDIMLRLVKNYVSDSSVAEELVQDAIFKAWKNLHQYDESRGKMSTWLCQIVKNNAIAYIRKRKRSADVDVSDMDFPNEEAELSLSDMYSYTEAVELVQDFFDMDSRHRNKWPANMAHEFMNYYCNGSGERLEDVAERTGLNKVTIRVIFSRCKEYIREHLKCNNDGLLH